MGTQPEQKIRKLKVEDAAQRTQSLQDRVSAGAAIQAERDAAKPKVNAGPTVEVPADKPRTSPTLG